MILKSFYRKKTTRIYLVILVLLFAFVLFVNKKSQDYIKEGNESFKNSYVYFLASKEEYSKIIKLKNVEKVMVGLDTILDTTFWENMTVHFIKDDTLKGNETIIAEHIWDNKISNGIFNINFKNVDLSLKVKEYYYSSGDLFNVYISEEVFNSIESLANSYYYRIKLKNWFKYNKTIKNIEKSINYSYEDLLSYEAEGYKQEVRYHENGNSTFEGYVNLYTIICYVLDFIMLVVLIVTIHNILIDEEKNTYLYSCLGYNKQAIKTNNALKVVSLILISIIIAFIILGCYILLL